MRAPLSIACAAVLVLLAAAQVAGEQPAKFFDDNCAMCHAIGGPPGGAPDLKDVTKRRHHRWLVRFILNPEDMAKHDPDAMALVKKYDGMVMPATEGASAETVEAVLRYIETAGGTSMPAVPQPEARAATPADVSIGQDLYEGRRRLVRRGPACVGCHRTASIGGLGGGTLGPDLTQVSQRLGGTRGMTTWLSNPPTYVMRALFRSRPLVDDERFVIAAMLDGEHSRPAADQRPRTRRFLGLGLAGALSVLAIMAVVWSRRMTAVRRPLVEAARTRVGVRR